jgi:hypothetical protein
MQFTIHSILSMHTHVWADVRLHDGVVRAGNVRGPTFDSRHHQQGPQMDWSMVARLDNILRIQIMSNLKFQ